MSLPAKVSNLFIVTCWKSAQRGSCDGAGTRCCLYIIACMFPQILLPCLTNYEMNKTCDSNLVVSFPFAVKNQVTFYGDCNYVGELGSMGVGNYSAVPSWIPNDGLSSLKVPSGVYVMLYDASGYRSSQVKITSDTSCLTSTSPNMNKKTSSIQIGLGKCCRSGDSPCVCSHVDDCAL